MVLRMVLESYFYLKLILNNLYLLGGIVDLLIGIDFVDVFNDVYVILGKSGELIVK